MIESIEIKKYAEPTKESVYILEPVIDGISYVDWIKQQVPAEKSEELLSKIIPAYMDGVEHLILTCHCNNPIDTTKTSENGCILVYKNDAEIVRANFLYMLYIHLFIVQFEFLNVNMFKFYKFTQYSDLFKNIGDEKIDIEKLKEYLSPTFNIPSILKPYHMGSLECCINWVQYNYKNEHFDRFFKKQLGDLFHNDITRYFYEHVGFDIEINNKSYNLKVKSVERKFNGDYTYFKCYIDEKPVSIDLLKEIFPAVNTEKLEKLSEKTFYNQFSSPFIDIENIYDYNKGLCAIFSKLIYFLNRLSVGDTI